MKTATKTSVALTLSLAFAGGLAQGAPAALTEARPSGELLGFCLSLGAVGVAHLDGAYNTLGQREDPGGPGLELNYDVGRFGRAGRLALGAGLLLDRAGPSKEAGDLQTGFEAIDYYVLAMSRWRQDRTVQPFVTIGGGLTRAELTLDSWSGRATALTMHGRAHTGFGRASLGVRLAPDLLTHRSAGRPVFAGVVAFEAGGMVGGRLSFNLTSSGDPGSAGPGEEIPVEAIRAGRVGTSGLFARLSVGVLF